MDLSIIIVNYNSYDLCEDCISSIYKNTSDLHYEIIVVDNDSKDNSAEKIKSKFPSVVLIKMHYNAGFSRANNAGFEVATGRALLILNSDTLIFDNALTGCYNSFMNSSYVACGIHLLNPDRSIQVSGFYFVRGGINMLLNIPYLGRLFSKLANKAKLQKAAILEKKEILEVDWINGAFIMAKKEIVMDNCMMDNDFFLYAEEVEWCSRLKKKGPLAIFNNYSIIHIQGETTKAFSDEKEKGYTNILNQRGKQILLSNFLRVRKQYGIPWLLINYFIFLFYIPFYLLLVFLKTLFFQGHKKELSNFILYTRNILAISTYLPDIIIRKPTLYKAV